MKFYLLYILTILGVFSNFQPKLQAAHLVGGTMTYEYIGDTSGIPHHYQINITLYRTTRYTTFNGIVGPNVCVASSCFPNQSVNMAIAPGDPQQGTPVGENANCISPNPNTTDFIEHHLVGHVVLPGVCSNYSFKYNMLCCRIGFNNIANVSGGPGNNNRLEVFLNNTRGENSSPQFVFNEAVINLCQDQNVSINHFSTDADGDSLLYAFDYVSNGVSCDTSLNLTYEPPYTFNQPFPADSLGIAIDQQTGEISFKSTNASGNYIYAFKIEDYRWVNQLNAYVKVGSSYIEGWVTFAGSCRPSVLEGPSLSTNEHPKQNYPADILNRMEDVLLIPNVDTVAGSGAFAEVSLHTVSYNCLSNTIDLYFQNNIRCNSIAPNGSDFRILSPDSALVPISAAIPNCTFPQTTDHVTLVLHNPLPGNGDFLGSIRTGTDDNTLINECGFDMPPHYTFVIHSDDCPVFSVFSEDLPSTQMRIYPNPNNGSFTVVANGEPHVLRVYNMLGVCVIEENGRGEHLVNQIELTPGNYIVRVEYLLNGRMEQQKMTVANK